MRFLTATRLVVTLAIVISGLTEVSLAEVTDHRYSLDPRGLALPMESKQGTTGIHSRKTEGGTLLVISSATEPNFKLLTPIEQDYLKFLEGGRYSRVQSIANGFSTKRSYSSHRYSGISASRRSSSTSYRIENSPMNKRSNFATIDNSSTTLGRRLSVRRIRPGIDSPAFATLDGSKQRR